MDRSIDREIAIHIGVGHKHRDLSHWSSRSQSIRLSPPVGTAPPLHMPQVGFECDLPWRLSNVWGARRYFAVPPHGHLYEGTGGETMQTCGNMLRSVGINQSDTHTHTHS